jgi:hypothetical protein
MSSTPQRLFDVAAIMQTAGEPLGRIGQRLIESGATQLDLVRVTMRIEGVDVATARRRLEEVGIVPGAEVKLTVRVDDDDPWRDELIRPEGPESPDA